MSYLKSVIITNFQSWKDATVEFSPGMNIFIAENNTGKSVLFKLIDVIVNYSRKSSSEIEQYIRHGEEEAGAEFVFSDGGRYGLLITLRQFIMVYAKDDYVCEDTDMAVEYFLKDMSLIVEPTSGFISNMIDDKKNKFLVDTDIKSNAYSLDNLIRDDNCERIIENSMFKRDKLEELARLQKSRYDSYSYDYSKVITKDQEVLLSNEKFYKDLLQDAEEAQLLYEANELLCNLEEIKVSTEELKNLNNINALGELFNKDIEVNRISNEELKELELINNISNLVDKELDLNYINREELDVLKLINDISNCYNRDIEEVSDIDMLNDLLTISSINLDKDILEVKDIKDLKDLKELSVVSSNYNYDISKVYEGLDDVSKLVEINNYLNVDISINKHKKDIEDLAIINNISNMLNYEILESKDKEIEELKKSMEGQIFKCPIYGEIVYKNGECMSLLTLKEKKNE